MLIADLKGKMEALSPGCGTAVIGSDTRLQARFSSSSDKSDWPRRVAVLPKGAAGRADGHWDGL